MPTVPIPRDYLFKLLGRTFTNEQFEDLCFQFGIELDDVTSEREMYIKEQSKTAAEANDAAASTAIAKLSNEVLFKIDTPANRYDLLSAESMCTALKVFLGLMAPPVFKVNNASSPAYRMIVDKSVKNIRDYVVCAVLKNINFTGESYNSFINFQDRLHSGLARKRTLASVGTHDLDKIVSSKNGKIPYTFHYKCMDKKLISFIPLNQGTRVLNCAGDGLNEFYKEDRHIYKFLPLITQFDQYPTVQDSEGNILSLPPIINSDYSKLELSTKNVFIECTAPDLYKAQVLVNQLVCAFSSQCEKQFEVEAVEVIYPEEIPVPGKQRTSKVFVTPDLSSEEFVVDVPTINKRVGIDINASECCGLLSKMCLYPKKVDEQTVKVEVPAFRTDILDKCDIVEDVAIAFGYDNIVKVEENTISYGYQNPISKLTHLLRLEIASAGYTEMLTFSLCSRDDAFAKLGRVDNDIAVHIGNPQTVEFQVCRPCLLVGALKTLNANKSQPLPIKLFEISDVVKIGEDPKNKKNKTHTINQRNFCAMNCPPNSNGFEDIQGLVEYVFTKMEVPCDSELDQSEFKNESQYSYALREGDDPAFFPGRAMDIFIIDLKTKTEIKIGHLGVIHPNTLNAYEIPFPCSYCEMSLQNFI